MDDQSKKRRLLLTYLIAITVGLLVAFGIMCYRGLWDATWEKIPVTDPYAAEPLTVPEIISDGCFVVSVLYVGFGLLLYVASTGALDMLMYAMRSLTYVIFPRSLQRKQGGFYEYKLQKKEKRKPVPYHILWIGLGFLLVSVLFLAI